MSDPSFIHLATITESDRGVQRRIMVRRDIYEGLKILGMFAQQQLARSLERETITEPEGVLAEGRDEQA